jgi:hypothetical protein
LSNNYINLEQIRKEDPQDAAFSGKEDTV